MWNLKCFNRIAVGASLLTFRPFEVGSIGVSGKD